MLDKILKKIILVQCLLLAVMLGAKFFGPSSAGATIYRAHNSADPEAFVLTITSIELVKEDGSSVNVWSGNEAIDLSGTSLIDAKKIAGNVPTAKYTKFKIFCGSNYPKIKGSVVVGGTTYYTKTNHTNFETGPAELEEIKPLGFGTGGFALQQYFTTPIELGGAISEIHVLLDLSNYLLYYDGVKETSGGYDPMGSMGGKAAMFLGELPFAIAVGNPGTKEAYEYYDKDNPSFGKGRLTLIFDNNDNLIGANAKTMLVDNTGVFFKLYGGFGSYGSAGVSSDYFKKNSDGTTYTVKFETIGPGAPTDAHTVIFNQFLRQTHEGSFTLVNYVSGTNLTVTKTTNGTYVCTKK